MSHLLKEYRGKVQLIYIDPPFDSRVDYKMKVELKGKKATNDISTFEEKQYGDIWTNDEYLQFMYERIVIMKELLSDTGVLYIHCDWHKGHYIKCIMDELFGADNFINEITWYYYNKMAPKSSCFPRTTDKILVYSKTPNYVFNTQYERREKPIKQLVRKFVDGKAINANCSFVSCLKQRIVACKTNTFDFGLLNKAIPSSERQFQPSRPFSTRIINCFLLPSVPITSRLSINSLIKTYISKASNCGSRRNASLFSLLSLYARNFLVKSLYLERILPLFWL